MKASTVKLIIYRNLVVAIITVFCLIGFSNQVFAGVNGVTSHPRAYTKATANSGTGGPAGATNTGSGNGAAGTTNTGGGPAGTVNPGTGGNGVLQINPPSIEGHQLPGNAFDLLNKVINFLTIDIMPVVISLVVLWSAFMFLTAGGDPKKINTAKQALFWAIIGAVVIIIGQGIILVVKSFFGLPTS